MKSLAVLVISTLFLSSLPQVAWACLSCAPENRTLTEEMNDSSVVILGKIVVPEGATTPDGMIDPETGDARFTVSQVLTGDDLIKPNSEITAIYFGLPKIEMTYLIRGVGNPPDWAIPFPLSDLAVDYVQQLPGLPAEGSERLAFFLDFLQHEDPLLAQDAHDEFARAPQQDVAGLGDQMDRVQLLEWIEDPKTYASRRRLFFIMLSACGTPEDMALVESMLRTDARVLEPATEAAASISLALGGPLSTSVESEVVRFSQTKVKSGLASMIVSYLLLCERHGDTSEGLDLVDQRFLSDPTTNYTYVYDALMSLNIIAEEQPDLVSKERLLASARLLLDNPEFADQVIPNLARWEDWSVLERLADMFKESVDTGERRYIREPIVAYLDVASEQEGSVSDRAIEALKTIEPLDSEAVKRARSLRAFGFLAQARTKPQPASRLNMPDLEPDLPEDSRSIAIAADRENNAKKAAESLAHQGSTGNASAIQVPNKLLLIGAPVLATLICLVLFWLILRS